MTYMVNGKHYIVVPSRRAVSGEYIAYALPSTGNERTAARTFHRIGKR